LIKSGRYRGKPISKASLKFYLGHRAQAYFKKQKYDLALTDVNKAIKMDAKYFQGYFLRAQIHYSMGLKESAITDYTKVIAIKPNWQVFNNRANAHAKIGQKNKAIADFRKSLAMNPSNHRTRKGLERLGVTP
jgi:tetratricopeptide (TPR) repeat protein